MHGSESSAKPRPSPGLPAGHFRLADTRLGGDAAVRPGAKPLFRRQPVLRQRNPQPATDDTLKLSLDEAVSLGLKNNLGLKEAENGEKLLQGEKNDALQEFLPTIILSGSTGVYQHNLAALGFGPGIIDKFGSLFPGGKIPAGLSVITRDDLTQGQIQFSQTLFSGPVIAG